MNERDSEREKEKVKKESHALITSAQQMYT